MEFNQYTIQKKNQTVVKIKDWTGLAEGLKIEKHLWSLWAMLNVISISKYERKLVNDHSNMKRQLLFPTANLIWVDITPPPPPHRDL